MATTTWMSGRVRRLSLTHRLLALAGVALLPGLAALVYFIVATHQERERELHDVALRTGGLASLEMERIITGARDVLEALALSPSVTSFDTPSCNPYLERVAKQMPHLRGFAVADDEGLLRCGTRMPAERVEVTDRRYFSEALQTGEFVIGEYTRSRVDDAAALPLALPIRDGTEIRGVLITGLDLDWLGDRIRERGYPEGSALTIADRDGVIIAREPAPERFVGTRIPEPFQPLVQGEAAGTTEVTSQDGTRRVIGYYPPARTGIGLYVSAGISTDTQFAAIYGSTYRSLALALAGAMGALILAALVGERLVRRPVLQMLGTVAAWQHGNTGARTGLTSGGSELGRLGSAIDAYMDQLVTDRAARQKAEAHRNLLLGEMEHRIKNILATVQAIASQTFRDKATPDSIASFSNRLSAMAEAHTILTTESWESADLRATIMTAVRPFGGDGDRARFTLEGDALAVTARAALAISMALHELCTNAAKYGALAVPAGRIAIEWRLARSESGERFLLSWIEQNGPPATPPESTGFGTRMIEASLGSELGAAVSLDYRETGLVLKLDAEAGRVVAPPPA